MNVIPKAGGNTTSGSLFASGTGENLQSNNLTPELERQGLVATPLQKVYDFSGTLGGPIARNRASMSFESTSLMPASIMPSVR